VRCRWISALSILTLLTDGVSLAVQDSQPGAPTSDKCSPPPARIGHVAEALDGKLYVFGGLANDPREDRGGSAWRYDPTTKRWSAIKPPPAPRVFAASAVLDRRILVMGGIPNRSRSYVALVEAYDPVGDAWEKLPDMPIARSRFGAAAVAGKVYVVSGLEGADDNCSTGKRLDEFDPKSRSWTRKRDIEHGRHACAAVAFDDRLFVLGGYLDEAGVMRPCNLVESYDPKTDTWRTEPPMNCTRSWFAAIVCNGALIALGGMPDGPPGPERLVRAARNWESLSQPDLAGRRFSASLVGGEILVVGGEGGERDVLRSICVEPAARP
jgi:N-acetylneuraminic acid mutarotase